MKIIEKRSTFTLLFLIILTGLLPGTPLMAQNSKRDEVRVPSEALKTAYTKEYFDGELKNFKAWLETALLPATGAEFRRQAKEYGDISIGRISLRLSNLRSLATNPDLEEVTRLPRSWYARIYNAALPMQSVVKVLTSVKASPDEKSYQAARRTWDAAVEETLDIIGKQPKKISKEEWEIVCAKNRERRKKEYIKWYRAKQVEDLKKAKEKAAGKKNTREME